MAAMRIDPQFERFLGELNKSLREAAAADQQLLAVLQSIQRSNASHEEAVVKLLNRLVTQVQEQNDDTRELISDQKALIDDVATDIKQTRKITQTIFERLTEDTGRFNLPGGPRTRG
jgi:ABC-type transporter Mla subunit MlaD